jgi:hypothetical protein
MDDWFTLALFLFFFVILPLLQGISQRRKGQQQELPEAEEDWDHEADPQAGRRRRIEPEEWEADWDERPVEEESAPARERSAWEDLGLDDLFREPRPEPRPAPQPEPRWEPFPTPVPDPRTERQVPVPRTERQVPVPRAERPAPEPRSERPAPVPFPHHPAPVRTAPRVVSLERLEIDRDAEHERFRRRVATPVAQPRRPTRESLLPDLREPREIRRAIIVAEVLGIPRAMQEHEVRQ